MTDEIQHDLESMPGWGELVAAGRVAPPGVAILERSRSAVRRAADTTQPSATVPARRPRRGALRLGLATAAAAVVAVAASLIVESPAGPSAAVAAATERLANVAASVPGDTVAPGQFRYRLEQVSQLMQREPVPTVTRSESWTAADGSVWTRSTDPEGEVRRGRYPATPLPAPLADLPREPRALLRYLEPIADGTDMAEEYSTEHALFRALYDLLQADEAPPDLRAALIRAVGLLPHVGVEEASADALGRPGVGLIWHQDDGMFARQEVFVIDPATARVLEYRSTATKVPVVDHTVYSLEYRTTLIETSIVEELPADMRGLPVG
jgi:hypothetical protein